MVSQSEVDYDLRFNKILQEQILFYWGLSRNLSSTTWRK